MKAFFLLIFICSLSATQSIATDARITTIGNETNHNLRDIELQCDKKNYRSKIIIFQDGAQVEIPLNSIVIMRSLQTPNGFYIKTTNGKELTNCKIPCQSYSWSGVNDFGGKTSIGGDKWHEIRLTN